MPGHCGVGGCLPGPLDTSTTCGQAWEGQSWHQQSCPGLGLGPLFTLRSCLPVHLYGHSGAGIIRRGSAILKLGSFCRHVGCPQELCVGGILAALRWWTWWSCFVCFSLIQRFGFWIICRVTFCQFNNCYIASVQRPAFESGVACFLWHPPFNLFAGFTWHIFMGN